LRFRSADEVLAAIEQKAPPKPTRRYWPLGLFAAAALVVCAMMLLYEPGHPQLSAPHSSEGVNTKVPPARDVPVRFIASPAWSRVVLDGEPLDCNPCAIRRSALSRHVAVARAEGYLEQRLEVDFTKEHEESVLLVKAPERAPPKMTRRPHPAVP